jgi:hypothetical protein
MNVGKTQAERDSEESLRCRQIVRTIVDFGVNERQKLLIIQLIALELEDREKLVIIRETVDGLLEEGKPAGLLT